MPQLGSRKSRKGCRRCKERRVKCNERYPRCANCEKRNEECMYRALTPSGGLETQPDPASPAENEAWIQDLELLLHYATVLYNLTARKKVIHLWRDYIPQQALKHPFLMHGLLAFAALHLAYLRPENSFKYLQLCDKHQGVALQRFRSILSSTTDPDPDLADALFALAVTLSLSSMARSCALSDTRTMSMDEIAELFILTRGIQNVIHLSAFRVKEGPMAEMMEDSTCPEGAAAHLPANITSQFQHLEQMLRLSPDLDLEALEHCQSALTELKDIYKCIAYLAANTNIDIGVVSRFQVIVPLGFVRLIQARNPTALIILAYYAAATTAIRGAWYAENWAEYALRGISQVLDDDRHHWIQWPMQQVTERMWELGVQSPPSTAG